jgi:protein ImuA
MSLQDVLQRTDIWRAGHAPTAKAAVATGFSELDSQLPGGGWPRGALTEINFEREGMGEFRLLLPALARLSRGDRWIALIAPPHIPYAPALAAAGVNLSRLLLVHPRNAQDHLWAVEASLRSGACSAVFAWLGKADAAHLRRLQLAAEAGDTWGVMFRQRPIADSPAALRLQLVAAGPNTMYVNVLKRRGGWPTGPLRLEVDRVVASALPAPSRVGSLHARHVGT